MRKKEITLSITQVVAISFCERKVVLDKRFGRKRTADVAAKAAAGEVTHQRFEQENRVLQARGPINRPAPRPTTHQGDARCFIASAVYGKEAEETNRLRAWRDRVLMGSMPGRWLVAIYYAVSPRLADSVASRPRLRALVRKALDVLVGGVLK